MQALPSFLEYIKKNELFNQQDKILLAVSGGKDSVLMVQLFKLYNYNFSIAHCNFNLRADESQRDESFVKMLAASLDVPFYVSHFDTKKYAEENHISLQMAARDLRYSWFEKIRLEGNYNYIALAQHQNDAMETVLLNLTRGTGISGMHGILPKRDYLVRPILFLTREEIDILVDENNIDFVIDSSNESTKYARNKIRLKVIPALKEINPNLEHTFQQNIQRFAETEEVLSQFLAQVQKEISWHDAEGFHISIAKLNKISPRKLILFELLKSYHFSNEVVDELLAAFSKQSGTSFYSPTHRATINREEILVSPMVMKPLPLQEFFHSGTAFLKIGDQKITMVLSSTPRVGESNNLAYVDLDLLIFPLIVRYRQEGDKFKPLGMNHYKKLSDFFINQKIALPQKDRIPLLINGNGEIIWVVGLRLDERYKVNVTTKKVAIFELSNF